MQAKLNYYSRYNRIKVEQKKSIPSLYSLLSTQTLNKLAYDASVSLQMISLYNRQNNFSMAEDQANQGQYLQANQNKFNHSLYHSLEEKAHSISPSIKNSRNTKMGSSLVKKQRVSKKNYLEKLVKEVRQKSLERVRDNEKIIKEDMKKQKQQIRRKSKIIPNQILPYEMKNDEKNFESYPQVNEDGGAIQNNLIKSLLTQSENSKKEQIQKNEQRMGCQRQEIQQSSNFKKDFVESVDDQNEEQSRHSIVIERLNLTKEKKLGEQEKKLGEQEKRYTKQQSKEDNPSQQDKKESEIKSYSKDSIRKNKPTKNLIEVELTHSQSQICKPQVRSLELPESQMKDQKNMKNNQVGQIVQKTSSINSKEQEVQEEMKDVMCEPIEIVQDSSLLSKSYKIIHSQLPIQFLSQVNHHKYVQQAPYQHPLQTSESPNKSSQQAKPNTEGPKKTSFKKFIMNKELNPRLVTSTILNQKNTLNLHPFLRELPKDHFCQTEKQNQQPKLSNSTHLKSLKKNFKKDIMMKKTTVKEQAPFSKEEKLIPLKKLENRKLLHGFFNDN